MPASLLDVALQCNLALDMHYNYNGTRVRVFVLEYTMYGTTTCATQCRVQLSLVRRMLGKRNLKFDKFVLQQPLAVVFLLFLFVCGREQTKKVRPRDTV